MPRAPRKMRLSAEHVRRVHRDIADPGLQLLPGYRAVTDEDDGAEIAQMFATRPEGGFWIFAYGSLIWNPATAFEESRVAVARGWHRRFCLGWDYRYRGNPEQPGLMLALDRGGQCRGIAYRLPEAGLEDELRKLLKRETSTVPTPFPWRWVDLVTEEGPLRALTFAMNRKSDRYIASLSDAELAAVLAKAVGFRGSMAEYLFSTVSRLEELHIHDRRLWRMQELVAAEIEARYGRLG